MPVDFISAKTMRRFSNSSYSLDMVLCDFYLFGYGKEFLIGKEFADREKLLETANHILESSAKVR
jgi:hypothetical protein